MARKAAAVLVALVMAVALLPATAVSAFADTLGGGLQALSSGGAIVYDTAYGVFGGEYALMMKTVTYDDNTTTVTDVVRADGTVTIHTSDALEDNDAIPGGRADYSDASDGYLLENGFFRVQSKEDDTFGVLTLGGEVVVPCEYDWLDSFADGFVAMSKSGSSVTMDIYTLSGTRSATLTRTFSGDVSYAWAGGYGSGLIQIEALLAGSWSEEYAVYEKTGSGWAESPSIARVYDYNSGSNRMLFAKTDGNVYLHSSDGNDIKLRSSDSVRYGDIYGDYVRFSLADSQYEEWYEEWYTVDGAKVDTDGYDVRFGPACYSGGYLLLRSTDADAGVYRYVIRAHDGTNAREFTSKDDNFGLLDSDGEPRLYTTSHDGTHHQLSIYTLQGELVKTLSKTSKYEDGSDSLSAITRYSDSSDGTYTRQVIGYTWTVYSSQDSVDGYYYYDSYFNELSYDPGAACYYLNGTEIFAQPPSDWDSETGTYTYTSDVTDTDGNPVTLGGYTLGIATDAAYYAQWNSVKHGNSDVWWATDSSGNWGAVDSSGAVVVPFVYDSYYDIGAEDTDYALVKQDGVWSFINVNASSNIAAQPMYRLYNPWSGEHFYTADAEERSNVIDAGWNDEGIGWYAPASGDEVYRLYNAYGGEHHYTLDAGERDNLIAAGWSYEGVGWLSAPEGTANRVPLYRQYNPYAFANNHNYTVDKDENDHLVSLGWRPEGIGWYGVSVE